MTDPYIAKILCADVYDVATETPLTPAPLLSERLGCDVHLKREDLQPIFSFKCRGAYNKMVSLSDEQRARGVVAASAGNHAQGVALAAQRLGVDATIVMPITTPAIKVDAVKRRGANVVLMGDDLTQLPFVVWLSRKTRNIVTANIVFALTVKVLVFGLAMAGLASLWMAVVADVGASLAVILNGMRLRRM